MKFIRIRLSYANVMSTIAVFGVLAGGGAWAASKIGTHDIKKGAVTAKKLHKNAVKAAKISEGAVGAKKIKDDSLTGAKVDESTLGQVPSALLGGFGESSADVFCNPESGAFIACASTENLDVPPGAAALVLGHVNATVDANASLGIGDCRLSTSSLGGFADTRQTFKVHPDDGDNGALVVVTPTLPPGPTSFGIECQDAGPGANGGIEYFDVGVSAVLISDGEQSANGL